jgi:hypothetical protein
MRNSPERTPALFLKNFFQLLDKDKTVHTSQLTEKLCHFDRAGANADGDREICCIAPTSLARPPEQSRNERTERRRSRRIPSIQIQPSLLRTTRAKKRRTANERRIVRRMPQTPLTEPSP